MKIEELRQMAQRHAGPDSSTHSEVGKLARALLAAIERAEWVIAIDPDTLYCEGKIDGVSLVLRAMEGAT